MADNPNPQTSPAVAPTPPVTPEELEEAYKGAAVFANKFYVTATGTLARLTFAEQPPGQAPVFRGAVAMSIEDLLKLGKLIESISANVQTIAVNPPAPGNG